MPSYGLKSGKKPKGKGQARGDVVALLNVCVQEIDQLTALLERLGLVASRERKEQAEMLTRILAKQAPGGSTGSLWTELKALSEVLHTHDQRVASSRAETMIALIELRARIRHHFHSAFECLAKLDPDPDDTDSDELFPQRRRWCCLKWC